MSGSWHGSEPRSTDPQAPPAHTGTPARAGPDQATHGRAWVGRDKTCPSPAGQVPAEPNRIRDRGGRVARDQGSATVWAAGAIAVLCLLAVAVLTYGDAVLTRHRAVAAADLAALAGAAYAPYGESAACDRARWVVAGMQIGMKSCRLSSWDALIEVRTDLPDDFGTLTVHSRAGPPPSDSPAAASTG